MQAVGRCVVVLAAALCVCEDAAAGAEPATHLACQVAVRAVAGRHSPQVPLDIVVSVTNVSTESVVAVEGVAVTCPPELPCSASDGTADQDLEPGRIFDKVVRLKFDGGGRPSPVRWLSFAAETYVFRVVVTYQRADGAKEAATAELPVAFAAALTALLGGALAGAVLVGSIGTLRRLLALWRSERWSARRAGVILAGFICLELPIGLLTAVAAMVVAHISTEFAGVLRIELKDVWAGVIVGMMAQASTGPVAQALRRYIPADEGSGAGVES